MYGFCDTISCVEGEGEVLDVMYSSLRVGVIFLVLGIWV